ncbi:phage tail assembly chaperone [Brevundimonas sp.]|uniref:phage tail assembly chaperone n=1 Tax=Brevundimonas sp. TaxID=1871086 RepID=UPI00345AE4A4
MLRAAARAGVTPAAFWRLSLKEWRILTERPAGPEPMGRDGFERMMAAWPDEAGEGAHPSTASRSPSPSLRDREET